MMGDQGKNLVELLSYAVCGGSRPEGVDSESMLSGVHNTCYELMARDYKCEILDNSQGQLCSTYPPKIIVPSPSDDKIPTDKLMDLVHKCRFARTRGRFVVPVLQIREKYVCRSSTLARSPEIYCRSGYGYWVQGETFDTDMDNSMSTVRENGVSDSTNGNGPSAYSSGIHDSLDSLPGPNNVNIPLSENSRNKEWMLDKVRNADINLLHFLRVDTIFDLMVEKKKVKFGMNVTSSEKVDRQRRYLNFNLLSVPYPGCEFFAEYHDCDYKGEGLMFDWKQNFVDADLSVPVSVQKLSETDWKDYVNWDLIKLTQNYLKLQLHSLMRTNSTGILLHCISGWDRTPLFVSLLRLSLWADGLVHQSLTAEEIIYFTVAYDWFLFSHQFPDRISKGEEIFYFCFDFLKYIESDEFSMVQYSVLANDGAVEIDAKYVGANGPEDLVKQRQNGHASRRDEFCKGNSLLQSGVGVSRRKAGLANSLNENENGLAKQDVAVMSVNHSSSWSPLKCKSADVACESNTISEVLSNEPMYIGECKSLSHFQDSDTVQAGIETNGLSNSHSEPDKVSCTDSCVRLSTSEAFSAKTPGVQESKLSDKFFSNNPDIASPQPRSRRSLNLGKAREFLIPAYNHAVREHQDHERQNTSFAATLFNHLSRTLNLVKR